MNADNLLPCPFCGEKAGWVKLFGNKYVVSCLISENGCGASSCYRDTIEEVALKWNVRVEKDDKHGNI
ncbi:MAG: Lar family restriction alleviation protein [Defluviitaleaceae bacterium]|nr:Lar family restriction alleviation protein [Defluviitaleaceae bacterium]MCL2275809.1 Lar family restriction alleviation protein [Defluviitaleaceae bacterium]